MSHTEIERFWSDWYTKKVRRDSDVKAASRCCQYILSLLPPETDTKRMAVLEVGCFDGTLTRILAQHFSHVTGIDVCEAGIEKAKATTEAGNVHYSVASLSWPQYHGFTNMFCDFDLVIVANMFQYVKAADYDAFFAGIKGHLKTGGTVMFIGLPEAWFFDPFLAGRLKNDRVADDLRKVFENTATFTKEKMLALCKQYGFTCDCKKLPVNMQTDETQHLFDVVSRVNMHPETEPGAIIDAPDEKPGLLRRIFGAFMP